MDVGLDWQTAKREREAAEAERLQRKAVEMAKKLMKTHLVDHDAVGILKLAALELAREAEDGADANHDKRGRPGAKEATNTSLMAKAMRRQVLTKTASTWRATMTMTTRLRMLPKTRTPRGKTKSWKIPSDFSKRGLSFHGKLCWAFD